MNTDPCSHRIQRSRAKGWRMPEGAVYVGRPTMWGNPWCPGKPGTIALKGMPSDFRLTVDLSRHDATTAFRLWLLGKRPSWMRPHAMMLSIDGWRLFWVRWEASRQEILDSLPRLRGRPLACWCQTDCQCHADVLLKLANS